MASIVPAAEDEQHRQHGRRHALGQEDLQEEEGHGREFQARGARPGGVQGDGQREVMQQDEQSLAKISARVEWNIDANRADFNGFASIFIDCQ